MSLDPKPPDDTPDREAAVRLEFMQAILRVAGHVRRSTAHRLSAHKLSPEEWIVLEEIRAHPGANQGHLADQTLRDRASLSRIVDGLEDRRLVTREDDKSDKRVTRLRLTSRGVDLLDAARNSLANASASILNGDGDESMQTALSFLDGIREGTWDK